MGVGGGLHQRTYVLGPDETPRIFNTNSRMLMMSYMAEVESWSVENALVPDIPGLMWQACTQHLA